MNKSNAGFLSTLIYTSISLLTSGLFLAVTLAGEYTWVARLGGAGWVFLLSMIVLMPIVTPMMKKRLKA
ncbi:MAG: hypothetical protein Q8O86_07610 [Dehalococcoidia bacterium]|nr:hypothetical protein [Dehalococcoidia bacterium]